MINTGGRHLIIFWLFFSEQSEYNFYSCYILFYVLNNLFLLGENTSDTPGIVWSSYVKMAYVTTHVAVNMFIIVTEELQR